MGVSSTADSVSTTATGPSSIAVMLIVWFADPVSAPPLPLLPPSLMPTVSVVLAGGVSVLAVKLTPLVALVFSRSLICASVPVSVTLFVPLPDTFAPLVPALTVNMPLSSVLARSISATVIVLSV